VTALPVEALLRLPERGAGALKEILRMAARGDWQTRALCLSAAGRIVHADPYTHRIHPFRHWVARRVPGLRQRFPSAGHRGKYVRNLIANALVDRSWVVRTAAALALGECRARSMTGALRPLLAAPYRAERIAAAAALVCCGDPAGPAESLLDGASPAPARIGDATRSIDFLKVLTSGHLDVLSSFSGSEAPTSRTPEAWAVFLAGPVPEERYEGPDAEINRYDAEGETAYLLTKPFSPINRTRNARLLHSFLVAAEHLDLPPAGRVLDLGGGSAWVSELLAKLGFRPFTLDLSSALLSLGRRRFAREGLPAVFREAYRVLADGGRFILAEPGEGHSETEKSRGEMLEHGVQEREIHLFEAIGYGREAGFSDIGVVPHYVPSIVMTPEDLRRAMRSPADQWVVHREDRVDFLPQFLLQSMLDRPIAVFRKGRRPVDSRRPGILKAEITPRLRRDGAGVSGTVTVHNAGDTSWLGSGDEPGQVRLGIQLLNAERRLMDMEFSRTGLGAHVPPGGALDINVALTLPDAAASYVLKIDLVDEGICWFEDVGSKPVYLPV
jgi:SAM-dependent methyltransferase